MSEVRVAVDVRECHVGPEYDLCGLFSVLILLTLPIIELFCFQILCIIHTFIYRKVLLPKIYHILLRTIKFMIITQEITVHLSTVNLYYGTKAITFKGCNLRNQLLENVKNVKKI